MIDTKIKLLYVEDHLDTQQIFGEILALFVEDVLIASNGEDALELFLQHPVDIIITDIQIPLMSGLEMIQEVRKINQDIPIIITSAFNEKDLLFKAIDLGVGHYLTKPILVDKLQPCLEKAIKHVIEARKALEYNKYLAKRVQEEKILREAKEQLLIEQNKYVKIGHMLGVVAHQWKQPLHYLNLLIEDIGLESEYGTVDKNYINACVKKGTDKINFLSQTMDNFLGFYKSNPDAYSFRVRPVVEEIVGFLSKPYATLGIQINTDYKGDFQLYGIENEFQQIILNLVNNAKEAFERAMKDNASIHIEISSAEALGIIKISDNATGVPENIIDKIFDRDYTTKENGNGIGLHLVNKLISKKLNGSVKVENTLDGALFIMSFKLQSLKEKDEYTYSR